MKPFTFFLAFPLLAMLSGPGFAAEPQPQYSQRWFYAAFNLLVDENADHLIALIERAGKSGYNGMVLADYKLNILENMPRSYFKNVARVQKAATAAGIDIVPSIFPIGYSNGLLAHDPNLAEGLPVQDAPFVVKGREAVLVPDPAGHIVNGDLEKVKGDEFLGFAFQDDPGKATFADHKVAHHGKISCRMEDIGRNTEHKVCRLCQTVKVRPHACYRLSCWVKTRDLKPAREFRLVAIGTSKINPTLTYREPSLEPTQEWTKIEAVFNSLDETEVNVYAGQWSASSGTIWVDELALEELALVNVLRRDGCPLIVVSADGQTVYEEGKDFEPVRDPQLGQTPYHGEFSFDHPGPALRLLEGSRLHEGDRLRVSWYHPIITVGSQVMCCLTEPKVFDLLRDQARRVNDLYHPHYFWMEHDEIRVAGWCKTCVDRHETPGALLAANVRRCVAILKEVNPKAKVVVWSDMFDPYHNAVDHYYLVNGTFQGSWKGLAPEVIIANWNNDKPRESLKWFADRGHPQIIAGYYDSDMDNFKTWDTAARGVPGILGFLYTTWQQQYDLLEDYGKALTGRHRPPGEKSER